jgi:TP901-1 family phage major tail protein
MTGQITVTTAKPLAGKKVFYFIQSIHAALGSNAILPAYRTDGSLTLGAEYSDEQTQQGLLLDKTSTSHEIELTTKFAPKDPSVDVLEQANDTGESVKIWRVLVDETLKTQDGEPKKIFILPNLAMLRLVILNIMKVLKILSKLATQQVLSVS